MGVDRTRVERTLKNLDGNRALRHLLERELGYDYEGSHISGDDLPEDSARALEEDPTLERLEEVFRFESNMAARRELNTIHGAGLTGGRVNKCPRETVHEVPPWGVEE